jgi:hypothetical protein
MGDTRIDTERILIEDAEFICLCGDTSVSDGFSACNSRGMQVEPTPQDWDGVRSTWRCAPPTAAYCRLLPPTAAYCCVARRQSPWERLAAIMAYWARPRNLQR